MDKNNVLVSVKGNQNYDNGIDDVVELITEGKYYKKGDKYYVTYEETEITGMEGTTTTIKLEDSKVTLMRFGQNNSQLIFERGQKHLCYYETVQGSFTVGVFSKKVDIDINDEGGNINVDYLLEIDNMEAAKNDFQVKITKKI